MEYGRRLILEIVGMPWVYKRVVIKKYALSKFQQALARCKYVVHGKILKAELMHFNENSFSSCFWIQISSYYITYQHLRYAQAHAPPPHIHVIHLGACYTHAKFEGYLFILYLIGVDTAKIVYLNISCKSWWTYGSINPISGGGGLFAPLPSGLSCYIAKRRKIFSSQFVALS